MAALMGVGAILLLLALVLGLKLHPFVALLLTSLLLALAAGIPVNDIAKLIEDGLGNALGHVALIVVLGAMIGRLLDQSGGAEAIARAMIRRFGDRRIPLAMAALGFLVGIPVFFEVGVIMLMPLAYGLARRTGRLLPIALPLCITLLCVHAMLPPHPGAVAVSGMLGADLGRVLLFGLPVAAVAAAVSAFVATRVGGRVTHLAPEVALALEGAGGEDAAAGAAPSVPLLLALILLPILLILGGTFAGLLPASSPVRPLLTLLGIPFVALLADVLLCAWLLGIRRGWSLQRVSDVMGAAIPAVALVILVTGGGAIFAKVLVAAGIGERIADLLHATGLPLVLLAFALTALIRAAQGPTTVALITVVGILQPYVRRSGLDPNHLALLCLAMGSGGIAFSHVNDAGFWIVTRLTGLDVADGLRTWTVLTAIAGFTGLLCVGALWAWL